MKVVPRKLVALCPLLLLLLLSPRARANMAAPANPDVGTAITFEKNQELAVTSEVLNITVKGAKAEIVATYTMENTTDQQVVTSSMFLSPNVEAGNVTVLVDGQEVPVVVESYTLGDVTQIDTQDWQYVVLDGKAADVGQGQTVDTILFALEFEPHQQYDVVVSYTYQLGGYPDYDYNVKRGTLEYYLRPAALWKDFSNLTINLHLDEDMPVLQDSNLEFEKVAPRTYQYVSDTLPEENLRIEVDQSWWQELFGFFQNPYLAVYAMYFVPVIVVIVVCVGGVIWMVRWTARRNKRL